MDCKIFQKMLVAYLAGELEADEFEQMVAHEADCQSCHRLAAEQMSDPAAGSPDEHWVRETLVRTVGSDCSYVELQLAAALDTARPADTPEIVSEHLERCRPCRSMASVLAALPDYYAAVPQLHADARFARDVVARTLGPKAGFREVVRVLLNRPSLLWEGAVICALLITPLAGEQSFKMIQSIRGVGASAHEQLSVASLTPTIPREVGGLGSRIMVFRDKQVDTLEREWSEARNQISDSLGRFIDQRPGENASVAVVRNLARRALEDLGLVDTAPSAERTPDDTQTPPPSASHRSTEIEENEGGSR